MARQIPLLQYYPILGITHITCVVDIQLTQGFLFHNI